VRGFSGEIRGVQFTRCQVVEGESHVGIYTKVSQPIGPANVGDSARPRLRPWRGSSLLPLTIAAVICVVVVVAAISPFGAIGLIVGVGVLIVATTAILGLMRRVLEDEGDEVADLSAERPRCPFRALLVRLRSTSNQPPPAGGLMSTQLESTAIAVARGHVEAWGNRDYDTARASLAPDVHVTAMSVDPGLPVTDLTGIENYMEGLAQFGQAVVPGTTRVTASSGDETRALLQVSSRVKFGPDEPEMTLEGSRLYLVDDDRKIKDERVIFYATA
jgi:hypothetical protein